MKLRSNAHTHTTFCDGVNTMEEMAAAAAALGFTSLGFSSHSPTPFDPTCPGVADELAYRAEAARVKEKYAGRLQIFCGMEQDAYAPVNRAHYDYIIGSAHYLPSADGTLVAVDGTPEHVLQVRDEVFGGDGIAMARAYYQNVVKGVQEFRPDVVGHYDLVVKHNQNSRLFSEEDPAYQNAAMLALEEMADILLDYGGIVEVNTGGVARGYRELPYPAPFLLRQLARRGVRVMVNSDSHSADTLGYGFDAALELLRETGFGSVAVLDGDGFVDMKI